MHLHNLIIKTSLVYNVSEFESSSDFKQGGLIFFIIINLKIKWKPVFYLKKKETKRRKRHQNNVHRWRFKPRDPYHALFHLMLRAHEPWPKCFSDTLYNLLLALGPLSLDHVFTIMYSGVKWKGCKSDLRSNWVLQIWLLQPWPLSALGPLPPVCLYGPPTWRLRVAKPFNTKPINCKLRRNQRICIFVTVIICIIDIKQS